MKIIGIGEGNYICEIENEEMATILGTDNLYDLDEELSPGSKVDLKRAINATRWLRDLDNKHIEHITHELKTTLERMGIVKETVEALTLFSKLKEGVK